MRTRRCFVSESEFDFHIAHIASPSLIEVRVYVTLRNETPPHEKTTIMLITCFILGPFLSDEIMEKINNKKIAKTFFNYSEGRPTAGFLPGSRLISMRSRTAKIRKFCRWPLSEIKCFQRLRRSADGGVSSRIAPYIHAEPHRKK